MYESIVTQIKEKLAAAGLYPVEAQARLSTQILKERLETVLP